MFGCRKPRYAWDLGHLTLKRKKKVSPDFRFRQLTHELPPRSTHRPTLGAPRAHRSNWRHFVQEAARICHQHLEVCCTDDVNPGCDL